MASVLPDSMDQNSQGWAFQVSLWKSSCSKVEMVALESDHANGLDKN